jgi:hypothetical protein
LSGCNLTDPRSSSQFFQRNTQSPLCQCELAGPQRLGRPNWGTNVPRQPAPVPYSYSHPCPPLHSLSAHERRDLRIAPQRRSTSLVQAPPFIPRYRPQLSGIAQPPRIGLSHNDRLQREIMAARSAGKTRDASAVITSGCPLNTASFVADDGGYKISLVSVLPTAAYPSNPHPSRTTWICQGAFDISSAWDV